MTIRIRLRRSPDRPLDCRQVGKVLQRYLDGHVDADTALRIDAHLDDCRRCGLELETYERIKITLAATSRDVRDVRGVDPDAVDRLREFGRQLVDGGASSGSDDADGH